MPQASTKKARARHLKKICPFAEFVEKRAGDAAKKAEDKVRDKLAPRAEFAAGMYDLYLKIQKKDTGKHSMQSPESDANLKKRIWETAGEYFADSSQKKSGEGD